MQHFGQMSLDINSILYCNLEIRNQICFSSIILMPFLRYGFPLNFLPAEIQALTDSPMPPPRVQIWGGSEGSRQAPKRKWTGNHLVLYGPNKIKPSASGKFTTMAVFLLSLPPPHAKCKWASHAGFADGPLFLIRLFLGPRGGSENGFFSHIWGNEAR